MTTHTREHLRGTLTFSVGYHLEEAEDRHCQYSGGNYRPDYLRVTLTSSTNDDGVHPRYKDLSVDGVVLSGKKIKKDGTPGQADTHERFYNYQIRGLPAWINEIIEAAAAEVKEGRLA